MPPNSTRVLAALGLVPRLLEEGGIVLDALNIRRYDDGSLLNRRQGKDIMVQKYGSPWLYVSKRSARADRSSGFAAVSDIFRASSIAKITIECFSMRPDDSELE